MGDLAALSAGDVANHRERLEIDFRTHDRGTEVEHHAPFEPFHRFGEDQEVSVACFAQRSAVAVGMFVNDVVADPDVRGYRDAELIGGSEDADVGVRIGVGQDAAAAILAQPQTEPGRFLDPLVKVSGLVPQSELAAANVARHAFGGRGATAPDDFGNSSSRHKVADY